MASLIRLIVDTVDHIGKIDERGTLLAVDLQAAFDSIPKDYMIWAFRQFGFGEDFVK